MAKKKQNLKSGNKNFLKALKSKGLSKLGNKKSKPRVDPLWTLDKGISYSMLSKFLNCRERFHISEVQGWKPKSFPFHLEFGNIFHHLDEAWGLGYDESILKQIPINYVHSQINKRFLTEFEVREYSICASVCYVTFMEYKNYWNENHSIDVNDLEIKSRKKKVLEEDFHWIDKEKTFSVIHKIPTCPEIKLVGKMDGLFSIPSVPNSANWLFETKTKGQIDIDAITMSLHKDVQTGFYLTAMRYLQGGRMPQGVLYNVIRRTQLKPGKQSPTDFAKRVQEDIRSRPDWYFYRIVREVTEKELNDFVNHQLNPALFQLVTWWNSIKKNPLNPKVVECECVKRERKLSGNDSHFKPDVLCKQCNGSGTVPNLYHYERALEQYDSISRGMKGEYFSIITDGNYNDYEVADTCFPELQDDDCCDNYIKKES